MSFLASLLLLLLGSATDGKVVTGHFEEADATHLYFLGKFCYSNERSGVGEAVMRYTAHTPGTRLLFFDDDVWGRLRAKLPTSTCKDILYDAGDTTHNVNGRYDAHLEGKSTTSFTIKDAVRPHHWYAFLLNCNGKADVEYELTFLNDPDGWERQLSYDFVGVPIAYMVFAFASIVLTCVHWRAHMQAVEDNNEACRLPTVHLVRWALLGFMCGNVLWLAHYIVYARDGIGVPVLGIIGEVLHILAEVIVLSVLLLIAQGWTVIHTRLRHKKKILFAVALFLGGHIVFLINSQCCINRTTTTYDFESIPGYIRLFVRLGLALWFLYLIANSLSQNLDDAKRRFYFNFAIGGILWFILVPISVIIAAMLPAYVREKAVICMRLISEFFTICGLMYAVWPTRAAIVFQVQLVYSVLSMSDFDSM